MSIRRGTATGARKRVARTMGRVLAIVLSVVVTGAAVGQAFFSDALHAAMASYKDTMYVDSWYGGNGGLIGFHGNNGSISFCIQPNLEDALHQTYRSWEYTGWASVPGDKHATAYLAYSMGHPSENKLKFSNYAASATCAFWLIGGASINWSTGAYDLGPGGLKGNVYSGAFLRISRADGTKVQNAVNKAKTYAGKSGVWDRASRVWYSGNGTYQDVIEPFKTGGIKVQKSSKNGGLTNGNSNYSLKNAKFQVFRDKACEQWITTLTTDKDGVASTSGLPVGTYYIKETAAPFHFRNDNSGVSTITVKQGTTVSKTFSDTPQTASIQLTKQSTDSKNFPTSSSDYSLKGAVYGIWEGRYSITNGTDGKANTKDDVLWGTQGQLSGVYEITSVNGASMAMDLQGGNKSAGAAIILYEQNGTQNQRWRLERATSFGSNAYYITSVTSGLRLAAKSTSNGAQIVTKAVNNSDKLQAWNITGSGGKYTIKNVASGRAIDIPHGEMTNGNQLIVWTASGNNNQLWKLRKTMVGKATTDANGVMTFSNLAPNTTYYLREISGPTCGNYEMNYNVIELKTGNDKTTLKAKTSEKPKAKASSVKIGTSATSGGAKEVKIPASGDVTITDHVTYAFTVPTGAKLPTKQFTVKGTLMDRETKQPFKVNGSAVTAQGTFTPSANTGSIDIDFTFPASALSADQSLVVYEELWGKLLDSDSADMSVATHKDITDAGQTVKFTNPSKTSLSIGTTATVGGKKTLVLTAGENNELPETVTITDKVSYTFKVPEGASLPTGELTLKGTLMDKATGAEFKVDGAAVMKTATFTPTGATGTCTMTFDVPTSALSEDTSLVVYEEVSGVLNEGDTPGVVATHRNIKDTGQTVRITRSDKPNMAIRTVATVNGKHEAKVGSEPVRIVDKVHYEFDLNDNALPQREFHVRGVLMDKTTGEELKHNGQSITGTATFTPTEETGEVEVAFDAPAEVVAGKHVVVFERVYDSIADGLDAVAEDDLENADQTVSFPSIGTTATDDSTGGHQVHPAANVTYRITDVVRYQGLIPGQTYTVTGTLMDKATGEAIEGIEPVSRTFKASKSDGTINIEFSVPSETVAGKTTVVFESLSHDGTEMATHADIDDVEQSVTYDEFDSPELHTTATDSISGTHLGYAQSGDITLIDTIAYKSLTPGKTYTASGTVMDKGTGKPLVVMVPKQDDGTEAQGQEAGDGQGQTDGQASEQGEPADAAGDSETEIIDTEETEVEMVESTVTASTTFTPTESDGTVTVEFTFPGASIEGKSLVMFEKLFDESSTEKPVATHEDISDEGQTVSYPSIGTTATDAKTGTHDGACDSDTVTINDEVRYTDLTVGKTYVVSGTLMDKATGEPLMDGEKEITASTEFTPEQPSGKVTVKFTFPAALVDGKSVVAFESVSQDGNEVVSHADIDDVEQTVSYPKIRTTATDGSTGTHLGQPQETTEIDDLVAYQGLVIGQTYTVTGTLMDKATGKAIEGTDGPITASTEFVADSTDGTVQVTFEVPGDLVAGKTVVAFENLYRDGREIAIHADINDEDQTVRYPRIGTTARYKANDSKDAPSQDGILVIVDRVDYEGLVPGQKYLMVGRLHDKEAEISSVGQREMYESAKTADFLTEEEGTSSLEFTPSEPNGFVELEFSVPAEKAQARDIVVFERLLITNDEGDQQLIASHEDLNDIAQTIHGPTPKTNLEKDVVRKAQQRPDLVATGQREAAAAMVALVVAAASGSLAAAFWRKANRRR